MTPSAAAPLWLIVAAVAASLFVAAWAMVRPRRAMWLLGAMLFFGCIAVIRNNLGRPQATWIMPLQSGRSELFLICGLGLGLLAVVHMPRMSLRNVAGPAWLLLLSAVYSGMITYVHVGLQSSVMAILFAIGTIAPMALVTPTLVADHDGRRRLIRTIHLVNVVWVAVLLIQLGIDRGVVTQGRSARLYGLTGNPQHTGVLLAVFGVVAVSSALRSVGARALPWLITLISVDVLLIIWTGSRTAGAMFVIGSMVVLRERWGRAVLLMPVAGLFVYVLLSFAGSDVLEKTDRLVSLQNTRAEGWRTLIESAMRNPIFGVGTQETERSENSYLFAWSSYGILMAGILALVGVAAAVQSFRLWSVRRWLDADDRLLANLVVGFYAMYFAGSVFEGYMLARVGAPLVFLLLFSSVGLALVHSARENALILHDEAEHDAEHDGYTEPYGADIGESWSDDSPGYPGWRPADA